MFTKAKQYYPPYKYVIKANAPGFSKQLETDDYVFGETWMLTEAKYLRQFFKKGEYIVITMFDMEIQKGPNIAAQYEKNDDKEKFYSLVAVNLRKEDL